MATEHRSETAAIPSAAVDRSLAVNKQVDTTGCWTFSLLPPTKPGESPTGRREAIPLALYHLGDNAKCGVFLADTNDGQTPTHLGIGSQVAEEMLQYLAGKHGFLLRQLIGFRDAPSQAAGDANGDPNARRIAS